MSKPIRMKARVTWRTETPSERAARLWAREMARSEERNGYDPRNHRGSRA